MNRFYRPLLSLACSLLVGGGLISAAKADPTPRPVMQPDGTAVVLSLIGDETFNCYMTTEGFPVAEGADGFFYYVGNDGLLTAFRVNDGVPASVDAMVSFEAYRNINSNMAFAISRELAAKPKPQQRVDKLGNSKWDNTDGHDLREVPTEGQFRIPVILVNFKDVKFVTKDPLASVTDMLNKPGYDYLGATGSVFDFYNTTSCGQFHPIFEVYGPVTLDKNEVEYVTTDPNDTYPNPDKPDSSVAKYPAGYMVKEACEALDSEIDFSQYDSNGDGMVDFVYFFFAGQSATTGGNSSRTIWPHAFTLTAALGAPLEVDGVQVNRYCCSGELGSNRRLSGIGTFTHEFGHVLGFPDLYDTSSNNGQASKCFTPGTFSTMDAANYNNDEKTPPHFSSYERYSLEWMKPAEITGNAEITLLPLSVRNFAYKIPTKSNPQEYFMVEARAPFDWDTYLQGHGLLIWHIDFNLNTWTSNVVNNKPAHQHIDLIEADDIQSADSRDGDVFPGSQYVCEYTKDQSPMFLDWNRRSTGLSIMEIVRNPDSSVSFKVVSEADNDMYGGKLESPAIALNTVAADKASLWMKAVENAESYMISVYNMKDFDGSMINKFVDGYRYKTVEDGLVEIDGLKPGETYGVIAYALSPVNASRSAQPLVFTTQGESFATTTPTLYDTWEENGTTLSWDAVADATAYELTVATSKPGETVTTTEYPFEGNKLTNGWTGDCRMENRDNFCGAAAPSYNMAAAGCYLETPEFEKEIKSISFWYRIRFSDAVGQLDYYGKDAAGHLRYIGTVDEFDGSSKGSTMTLDIPSGYRSVRLVYTMKTTGLNLYLDDISVALADGAVETPLSGFDARKVEDTKCLVTGLENDTEYVARVVALKGNEKGISSETYRFVHTAEKPTAIESVGADSTDLGNVISIENGIITPAQADLCYSVYTIDGRAVTIDRSGSFELPQRGIYIVRSGKTATKVNW